MDALEALRTRRSFRVYENKPVPNDLLETIVDCGRLAASARNEQPWEFVVVTDPALRKQIADATDFGKHVALAGACILVFCKPSKYYLEDGCAATQNMLVAARALGLGTCWIAGDKKPYGSAISRLVRAPEDLTLVSIIAVGYGTEVPSPVKRPLGEVLHWGQFS
ncbi:MAG: nitroreductase family protein [Candidatus Hydrogenedentes bacterium]|nr:nitroreductase family protein [Candidatus Hydrogenedentota bacterium]